MFARVPRAPLVAAAVLVALAASLLPTPALAEVWEAGVEQRPAAPDEAVTGVEPFEMIAVSWTGRATTAPPLEVHSATGWEALPADPSGPDSGPDDASDEAEQAADEGVPATEQFTEPVWVGSADGYRLGGAARAGSITVHLIRQHRELRPVTAADTAGASPAAPDGPPVNLRSAWGAASAKTPNDIARSIKFAVVHHTVGTNNYTPADVPAILRGIQSFHQNSRGWNDIAYNFLVDQWGGIWEGRSGGIGKAVIGSHAANFNTGTVGISLMGDFSATEPSAAMLEATAQVAGWKLALAGVDPMGTTTVVGTADNVFPTGQTVTIPTIVGHRDVGTTSCPGLVWNHLAAIRARAADRAAYVKGTLDEISSPAPNVVKVRGWAFDRRTTDQVRIVVDVNGKTVSDKVSSVSRPDVNAVFGGAPLVSGFDTTVNAPNDSNDVCVYAAETSYGALTRLGCRNFNFANNPKGNFEALTLIEGGARASGWAFDPNTTDPIDVHVVVDDALWAVVGASRDRPDVGAAFPGRGSSHGWVLDMGLPGGRHTVCVFAINAGLGTANTLLGCREIGEDRSAIGVLDGVALAGDLAVPYGWAYDKDAGSGSIGVLFFVNDRMSWLAGANLRWPNLAPFFGADIDHGFFTAFPIGKGTSNVCAYALNVGPGNPATKIGCRTLRR